ncbi:MAG: metallophosphatase family protein [Actinomycetota bacterium]|nr:metallophosphatase family protein [Actinomycetota bacterium]
MRVAALYDVHGNLPALDAVLADVEKVGADLIVFGGDIATGPFPHETLERVRSLGTRARAIRGNADRALLELLRGSREPTEHPADDRWVLDQLTDEDAEFLAALAERETIEVPGLGGVLFCHATPRSDEAVFTALTPAERVREAFAGVRETVVVCGHTHMQFDRRIDATRVVNAGSVGIPYGDEPGAYWALLGPDVEHRRTAYDRERAAAAIAATGWPPGDEFARENVLTIPTAAQALEVFERLASQETY